MLARLKRYTDPLIFVLLLPVGLSIVAFYGFTSGYTTGIYTHEEFGQQFSTNIYRYRLLGTKLHGILYDFIKHTPIPKKLPSFIEVYCPGSVEPALYSSVFYFNMTFMVLLSLVVYLTIRKRVAEPMSTFAILIIQLLVTLSSFVFIHYDVISCFFLCLAFYIIYFGRFKGSYIVVAVVLLLATLTRETSALILSLFALKHREQIFSLKGGSKRKLELVGLVLIFVLTYVGLRMHFGTENAVFQHTGMLWVSLSTTNYLFAFMMCLALALLFARLAPRENGFLLLLASPYILAILIVGVQMEIRLWTPIWILLILVGLTANKAGNPTESAQSVK